MRPAEYKYLVMTIENEGFDYAFVNYSDFEEIEDEEFHTLRKQYLDAREKLTKYLDLDFSLA